MPSAETLIAAIRELQPEPVKLMEVCGTHTHAIARAGIRTVLPEGVELLSGPGCPVCVTPAEVIDQILSLSMEPGVIIASYGDMLRVPGSVPGDSLQRRRALGARVEIVYSPMDAIEIARQEPAKEVVFLGVGFETTAPGTAIAALTAAEQGVKNFTVWSLLKRVEPALRALLRSENFQVKGFLCPGHVATIIGAEGFRYLPEEYRMPAVVSGFEPEDILLAVYHLLRQLKEGSPRVENDYPRAVSAQGNLLAQGIMARCLAPRTDLWRGLGEIPDSGLGLNDALREQDAQVRFGLERLPAPKPTACRCGEVITGRLGPVGCPLFGTRCTPEDPVGPCMVSSEGACSAAYLYRPASP